MFGPRVPVIIYTSGRRRRRLRRPFYRRTRIIISYTYMCIYHYVSIRQPTDPRRWAPAHAETVITLYRERESIIVARAPYMYKYALVIIIIRVVPTRATTDRVKLKSFWSDNYSCFFFRFFFFPKHYHDNIVMFRRKLWPRLNVRRRVK